MRVSTWWSRACNADREAIVLLDSKEAERLLQDADLYYTTATSTYNKHKKRPCTATSDAVLTRNRSASHAWSCGPTTRR